MASFLLTVWIAGSVISTPISLHKSSSSQNSFSANADRKSAYTFFQTDPEKGRILISKSDCIACHKEKQKLIGPSYHDIAAKYAPTKHNIEYLTLKIVNGGSGVWGQIPMAAHPALSKVDVEEMVNYILSIK
jgi:cytochrome c